jgi:DNA-binding MarR family transcriptional regulator
MTVGPGRAEEDPLDPDALETPPPDRRSINRRLAALFRMGDAFITRELRGTGLTSGPAYFVLELAVGGTLTLTEVSRRIGVDRAHTTRIARRLVEEGFATRAPDPTDGRGALLTLTQKGEHAAVAVEQAIRSWVAVVSDGVSPEDLAATSRAFDRFYTNATKRLG